MPSGMWTPCNLADVGKQRTLVPARKAAVYLIRGVSIQGSRQGTAVQGQPHLRRGSVSAVASSSCSLWCSSCCLAPASPDFSTSSCVHEGPSLIMPDDRGLRTSDQACLESGGQACAAHSSAFLLQSLHLLPAVRQRGLQRCDPLLMCCFRLWRGGLQFCSPDALL